MLIRETDFDKHLEMLENSEGEVYFLNINDNPARFQEKVVEDVLGVIPSEIILLFHRGVGEKKSRSIARSILRSIQKVLDRRYRFLHVFILPSKLFKMAEIEFNRHLN